MRSVSSLPLPVTMLKARSLTLGDDDVRDPLLVVVVCENIHLGHGVLHQVPHLPTDRPHTHSASQSHMRAIGGPSRARRWLPTLACCRTAPQLAGWPASLSLPTRCPHPPSEKTDHQQMVEGFDCLTHPCCWLAAPFCSSRKWRISTAMPMRACTHPQTHQQSTDVSAHPHHHPRPAR